MTTLRDHGRSEIQMLRCPLDDNGPSLYPRAPSKCRSVWFTGL